jgi:hypothetical protein
LRFSQVEHPPILAWLAVLAAAPAVAQNEAPLSLDTGYRQMYNLQFEDAHGTFQQWQREHPESALGPVSEAAAYLFTELDRMRLLESEFFVSDYKFLGTRPKPDTQLKRLFEATLEQGSKLAEEALARNPKDADALFARMLRHGLSADYYSLVEKSNYAALRETIQSREAGERLLAVRPDYYDAHLAVGIENYLLSLKPAPLRWLLRVSGANTDREAGLEKLRVTAEKGRYLLPFARLLLAVAALRDRDTATARHYLNWLAGEFPLNRLYREELAKLK